MRVVVSGGGTGGHIFPALALCEALKEEKPHSEVLYIGSTTGMEAEIVPKTGVRYQSVPARKLRKVASFGTVAVALSLLRGFAIARRYMREFEADAVVGTGGYVAAAAALAGVSLGLPATILAPDSVPGRTNRLLARYARRICVVFEETVQRFDATKTVVTGLPLRQSAVAADSITKREAQSWFPHLDAEKFTVLVIGGSQGARWLNETVLEALPVLLSDGFQVLHQTGPKNIEDVRSALRLRNMEDVPGFEARAFLIDFEVAMAYRAADVIVCRGGISTLAEVMANGLPALVTPLPTAYADHQTANARAMERAGAAICCPQSTTDARTLHAALLQLRSEPHRHAQMAAASRAMGRPAASEEVANLVFSTIPKGRKLPAL